MKNSKSIFCFLFLVVICFVHSQEKNKPNERSYLLIDLSYQNDAVFMGRHDTVAAPYTVPSVEYYDKSGFFAVASLSYLTKPQDNRIDLFLLTTGYSFNSNKFSGIVSGTKYFFNEDSYAIQSEIQGDISATIAYETSFFKISLNASGYINNDESLDLFAGFQLDNSFYFLDDDFIIKPTFCFYAGSQYFYQEYYKNNSGNQNGNNNQGNPPISSLVRIEEVEKFNVLNIEVSLPIQYRHNSFIFSLTPYWAFPQSNLTIVNGDEIFREDPQDVFYWSAGISYWFHTKKSKF